MNGASSREVVTRHSCRVAWAAGSLFFQNRGRLRRTYQLERSSMNRPSRLEAPRASNASRAAVTSATVSSSSPSTHRSSTCVGVGAGPSDGDQPSMSA